MRVTQNATLATCASSENGEYVGPLRLWDVPTGTPKRDVIPDNIHGRPMALSPDGSIVATGGKSVKLWDTHTGKPLRELFGILKRTQSIAFSADGKRIVAGGSYGTTNLWDVSSGRLLVTLFTPSTTTDADAWFACTPEGFYDGSPDIDPHLAWRTDDHLVRAQTLAPQLHHPDRITAALRAP